jgi:hypothetical protein
MRTRSRRTTAEQRGPESFGWTPADLRSAYAFDGTGPYLYAPDGAGPFSYDVDGSGPYLVGPDEPKRPWSPRSRGSAHHRRRLGTAMTGGALALVLAVGSIGAVVAGPLHHHPETVTQASMHVDED